MRLPGKMNEMRESTRGKTEEEGDIYHDMTLFSSLTTEVWWDELLSELVLFSTDECLHRDEKKRCMFHKYKF